MTETNLLFARFRAVCCLLLTLCCLFGSARLLAATVDLTPQERAWIKAHPEIVFGVDIDWQPQFIAHPDGRMSGIDGDIVTRLNQMLGTNIVIRQGKWSDLVEQLKTRQIDGLTSSAVHEERRSFAAFSDPYVAISKMIYVRSDNPARISRQADLAGKRIAIQAGNLFDEKLLKSLPGSIEILHKPSLEELVATVLQGGADGFVGSISIEYRLLKLGISQVIPVVSLEPSIQAVFSIRRDWPELQAILNKGLQQISESERLEIKDRYLAEGRRPGQARIALTPAEQAWLAAKHTVRVAIHDYPPYQLRHPVPAGIAVDYLEAIASRFGFKLEYVVKNLDWPASLGDVAGGHQHFDLLPTLAPTPERLPKFAWTTPYFNAPWVIYTRDDSPLILDISNLNGKTVAAEKGFAAAERLRTDFPDIRILEVGPPADALQAVSTGKADAYIGNLANANYLIRQLGLTNLRIGAPASFLGQMQGSMGVRQDWPELASLIDKGMAAMSPAEQDAIRNRWVTVDYQPGIPWHIVSLGSALVLLAGALILLWNRMLKRQVAARTQALQSSEASLRKLSQVVEQSPESIIITDRQANIEYVNESFVANYGFTSEEVLGQNPRILASGNNPPGLYGELWAALQEGKPWCGEFLNRKKDGTEIIVEVVVSPIHDAAGQVTHFVALENNISALKAAESEIHRLINYDRLTGLPNRSLFIERLERALTAAQRQPRFGAVILLDIDRFKNINDARSHDFGDRFLVAYGGRLAGLLREEDTLARLTADEFAILLPDLGGRRESAAQRARAILHKIVEDLQTPYCIEANEEIFVTVSMGLSLFPKGKPEEELASEVIRRADTALNRAKASGGNRFAFFDTSMEAQVEDRFLIENELRHGIAAGELRLFLQAQVDAAGQTVSAEALVRWQHPERGLLAPGMFIAIAEESDLIVSLGEWVMHEACCLIAQQEARGQPLHLSVNISPRHFAQPRFVSWLKQVLSETGADPLRLTLEVTEGLMIDDVNAVIAKMTELVALGVHFSIDDFGTGYSSLAYIKRLPIHELKIDKSFVQDAPTNANDAALVETILSIARHMGLKVVAEGVETQAQADFLNARATVIHQGYLYGKPQAAAEWIAARDAETR